MGGKRNDGYPYIKKEFQSIREKIKDKGGEVLAHERKFILHHVVVGVFILDNPLLGYRERKGKKEKIERKGKKEKRKELGLVRTQLSARPNKINE